MSKEKRRVPRLRFPGFTGDWEQRKLLTVLNKIVDYRGRTPQKLGLDWSPTGHLALSALNVKMGYVDKTVDAHYGDDHLYNVWMKDNDLYKGQVLFTTEAPMGNVAQVPDDNKYILSQRTIAFIPDRKVISDNFLAVALSASKCQKSLINRASGGTAKGVSQKTLSEISLDIPQSLSEQDKVSELIKKLSKIITLHQRKLNHLILKKKSLLQRLFPKNGGRYPELRFPGFTDAWEQRKLSEITTCFDNLRVPVTASDRVSGKTPYYGANGIQDYVSGNTHSGEFVLIAEDGANDLNDYPIQYVNGEIWVNNHAHVISGFKEKLDNKFLSYALKTVKMKTFIVGSGRSKLNLKALLEIPISMPNYNEQCFVGRFIDKIDTNITLHQRKLDHLQLQKKALLQQMFV